MTGCPRPAPSDRRQHRVGVPGEHDETWPRGIRFSPSAICFSLEPCVGADDCRPPSDRRLHGGLVALPALLLEVRPGHSDHHALRVRDRRRAQNDGGGQGGQHAAHLHGESSCRRSSVRPHSTEIPLACTPYPYTPCTGMRLCRAAGECQADAERAHPAAGQTRSSPRSRNFFCDGYQPPPPAGCSPAPAAARPPPRSGPALVLRPLLSSGGAASSPVAGVVSSCLLLPPHAMSIAARAIVEARLTSRRIGLSWLEVAPGMLSDRRLSGAGRRVALGRDRPDRRPARRQPGSEQDERQPQRGAVPVRSRHRIRLPPPTIGRCVTTPAARATSAMIMPNPPGRREHSSAIASSEPSPTATAMRSADHAATASASRGPGQVAPSTRGVGSRRLLMIIGPTA